MGAGPIPENGARSETTMVTPEAGQPAERPSSDAPPSTADRSVNAWNAEYIERLYAQWKQDPGSLTDDWNQFFLGFDLGRQESGSENQGVVGNSAQARVDSLIYHYRDIGHFAAELDPLGTPRPFPKTLTLESFELGDDRLEELFDPGSLPLENPSTRAAARGRTPELLSGSSPRLLGAIRWAWSGLGCAASARATHSVLDP